MEQESNNIDISKIRTFDEIFKNTHVFLKANWRQYFSLLFIYVGPFLAIFQYTYSNYVATVFAQIAATESIALEMPTKTFLLLAIFGILAFTMFYGISYSFIEQYRHNKEIIRSEVISHFNTHMILYISATITSTSLLLLGFMLYIIPGILLFFPLHFYVYDKLQHKGTFAETMARLFTMTRANIRLVVSTLVSMHALLFIIRLLFAILFASITAETSVLSILFSISLSLITMGISVIPVILLYHTIYKKTYDTH